MLQKRECDVVVDSDPVKVLCNRDCLGHSSISITMDLYSHVFPHMQSQARDQISEILNTRKSAEPQTS